MLAGREGGFRERPVLVHAREDEDRIDLGMVDHSLGAGELRIEVIVTGGTVALAGVDVVDGGDMNALGCAKPLDHPPVRPGEDTAAADHADAEAHALPRATR